MFTPIHNHMLITGLIKTPITLVEDGKKFLVDLVNLIGMVPVTDPQAVYVDELGNEGLTGSINLATSHIAFHIWDKTGLLMMDVYSCKSFDSEKIIDFIENLLTLDTYSYKIIDREDFKTIEVGGRG